MKIYLTVVVKKKDLKPNCQSSSNQRFVFGKSNFVEEAEGYKSVRY